MRKLLCVMLAALLLAAVPVSADGENQLNCPESGITLFFPEIFQNMKGSLIPLGGMEAEEGSGIYFTVIYYLAMSQEEYMDIALKEEHTLEDQQRVDNAMFMFFQVFAIDGGRTFSDINVWLESLYGPEAVMDENYARELTRVGDITFYRYDDPEGSNNGQGIDPVYADEFRTLSAEVDSILANASYYVPVSEYGQLVGRTIDFETMDIYGNPVSSRDLFGQHACTMLNIWTTSSDFCIDEMSELEAIHQRLAGKDCGVVGLLYDGTTDELITLGRNIMNEHGISYPVILPPDNVDTLLPVEGFPTTYYIDREGRIMGEPTVGSKANDYEGVIDSLLG